MAGAAEFYCIGWWNIGMRGKTTTEASEDRIVYITAAIHEMKVRHRLDVLFLGEVTDASIKALRPLLKRDGFRIARSVAEMDFGLAVAYDSERLSLDPASLTNIIHRYGRGRRKVAQRVDVTLKGGARIGFYFLHWPSRLKHPVDSDRRAEMAAYLQGSIARFRRLTRDRPVIVLGDFNDEPNDKPLSKLLVTRHLHMAQKSEFLLYNPFWRFLADPVQYSQQGTLSRPQGTYYYRGGETHRWHIVDQMLFSSSFFGDSEWHLAEERTTIFEIPGVCEIGPNTKTPIDHLPILAAIERAGE